ncbi:MAG: hypothetical protein SVZ03_02505 [Spirochaetota bacterium]|nr:hypothetical protein [Spirochaetota bacterium]
MLNLLWHLSIAVMKVHINQWFPRKWQLKKAEKRVIQSIHCAYEMVPYYRKKYDEAGVDINSISSLEDLKRIPFITKEEILEQYPEGIVAMGVDLKRCHYSATTGSTGRSLPFIFNTSTYAFYLATSLRVYTMIGYRPWHKIAYIKYTAVERMNFGPFFRAVHIPSILPVKDQIRRIRKERPDLLEGYASIILEIARTATHEELKDIRPKFISVNSEMSTQEERDFISQIFGCPVYDEYSTEETWMIASQCHKKNYHIFTDNVWVEFLNSNGDQVAPGEAGEMVLTTLQSPAMPFIRYRIGDIGRSNIDACSCSIGFPLLKTFEGRADDSFILPSGKSITALKLLNAFTMHINKHLHLIEEFKLIQRKRDHIVIQLVIGKEFNEDRFQEIVNKLHEILGESVTITIEMVNSIPTNGSIKRKAIESHVNDRTSLTQRQASGEVKYISTPK